MKFFIAALALASTIYSVEIINPKTGFVDVEIQGDEVVIHNRFIKAELEQGGIAIPENLRAQFSGQELVQIADPLFGKAFLEIYSPSHPELEASQMTANQ